MYLLNGKGLTGKETPPARPPLVPAKVLLKLPPCAASDPGAALSPFSRVPAPGGIPAPRQRRRANAPDCLPPAPPRSHSKSRGNNSCLPVPSPEPMALALGRGRPESTRPRQPGAGASARPGAAAALASPPARGVSRAPAHLRRPGQSARPGAPRRGEPGRSGRRRRAAPASAAPRQQTVTRPVLAHLGDGLGWAGLSSKTPSAVLSPAVPRASLGLRGARLRGSGER